MQYNSKGNISRKEEADLLSVLCLHILLFYLILLQTYQPYLSADRHQTQIRSITCFDPQPVHAKFWCPFHQFHINDISFHVLNDKLYT